MLARQFSKRAGGYESEATEQLDRLASIKVLPKNPDTGEWQWPFSERDLGLESPIASILLNELESLNAELHIATGQRPKLDAYLSDLNGEAQEIAGVIKEKETELSAAIAANEMVAQIGTRNTAAARVVGPHQPVFGKYSSERGTRQDGRRLPPPQAEGGGPGNAHRGGQQ